jgi:hypothetical protein
MGRMKKPDPIDQAKRLAEVQTMVKDMVGAMPSMAREIQRNALETLGDVITELVKHAPKASKGVGAKAAGQSSGA